MSKANPAPNTPPAQGQGSQTPSPPAPPPQGQVKIHKNRQWVFVTPKGKKQKGMFTYVEFTDDDGLDTWWIVPPQG
jgi:hypothetical protein